MKNSVCQTQHDTRDDIHSASADRHPLLCFFRIYEITILQRLFVKMVARGAEESLVTDSEKEELINKYSKRQMLRSRDAIQEIKEEQNRTCTYVPFLYKTLIYHEKLICTEKIKNLTASIGNM